MMHNKNAAADNRQTQAYVNLRTVLEDELACIEGTEPQEAIERKREGDAAAAGLQRRQERRRIFPVQVDARNIAQKDQLLRSDQPGDSRRSRVGIYVVLLTVGVQRY